MQITETAAAFAFQGGCAPVLDTASIITKVLSTAEARALPAGTLVGDMQGGLTFSDAVAAELESRSTEGWHEVRDAHGEVWTVIVLA